ncbi:MAG: hypothetical protein WC782_14430 [Methylococcaceae bacterium]|jgi:hypothetical protein
MNRLRTKILITGLVLVVLAEIAVRLSGITDFPLYDANSQIGYIPKASQSGDFLRTNHWQFNSKNMGAAEFTPTQAMDNLLIGDSVVLGGNPYRQEDRLGPQLSKFIGQPVWPISAGSWALRNELSYLRMHPDVVSQSDRFVFVLNGGDFEQASSWSCEKTHPRSRPISAALYVFRKYVWDWGTCGQIPNEVLVPSGDWRPELQQFLASDAVQNKPVVFFLYPDKAEMTVKTALEAGVESHVTELRKACPVPVLIYSVGRDPRWKLALYKDGIHPSKDGVKVLAEIIGAPSVNTKLP